MSHWDTMSKREQKQALGTLAELAGHRALQDAPQESPQKAPQSRVTPDRIARAPTEHQSQQRLIAALRAKYGYLSTVGHVPERQGARAGQRAKDGGQVRGYPDVTFEVPGIRIAIELKHERHRPAQEPVPMWWREWIAGLTDWAIAKDESHHGLRASQAERLRYMYFCGWRVCVAWDADAAIEFVAGAVKQIDAPS